MSVIQRMCAIGLVFALAYWISPTWAQAEVTELGPTRPQAPQGKTPHQVVVHELESMYADAFSGSEVLNSSVLSVRFKGAPRDLDWGLLSASDLPIQVVWGERYTAVEKRDTLWLAGSQLTAEFGVSVRLSFSGNTIQIQMPIDKLDKVRRSQGSPPIGADGVRDAARKIVSRQVGIDVMNDDDEVAFEAYGRTGGAALYSSGSPICTSGFVVKARTSTALGVLTAAHCGTPLYHENSVLLSQLIGHIGQWGDWQFMHSMVMMDGKFRSDWGMYNSAYNVGSPSKGDYICKFGISSGKTCGYIADPDACITIDGTLGCSYVTTTSYMSAPGDSGGPWFNGTTAIGIHTGGSPLGGYSVFTRLDRALYVSGTYLCHATSPYPNCTY